MSSAVLSWVLVFTCGEAWLGVLSLAVYMADLTGFSLLRGKLVRVRFHWCHPGCLRTSGHRAVEVRDLAGCGGVRLPQ